MNPVAKNANRADLHVRLVEPPTSTLEIPDLPAFTEVLASRDGFMALIGHELRNSIAPLLLLAEQLAEVAKDPVIPAGVGTRIAMLTRNLHRCVTRIDRVAEIADLRRGKLRLALAQVDLTEIVAEVCRDAQREAAAGGAELVLEAGAPVTGTWDRGRVKQIASNLVSNAIRYSGGGRIELRVRDLGDAGELVVRDHGPGIDPARLPELFDRLDHTRGLGSGGFGAGLWVVKTLCAAMCGQVSAENIAGGGSQFCVVLPRG